MTTSPRDSILALLQARSPDATICPSEVARAITSNDSWRDAMPAVHAAVDHLVDTGEIALSWKGEQLTERSGPYRIARR